MVRGKVTAVTEFVFTGLKKGAAGIGRVGKAAVTTAAKSKILQTNIDGVGRAFKRAAGFATKWTLVAAGVATGAILAGKSFLDLFGRSQAIGRGFQSLAKFAGVDATKALAALRKETRGTVSDIDLMTQANNAFLLKIPLTEKRLGLLAEGAFKLGKVMGKDALFGLESLTTGIGRQSRLMLDNLGIIVRSEDAYKRYAKQLGVTVSKLTEQQRKLAFAEAAFAGIEDRLRAVGDVQEDASDKLARLGVKWDDLKIKIGEVLAESPAVEEFMVGLAIGLENATKWFNENREDIKLWIAGVIDAGKAAIELVGNIGDLIGKLTLLDKLFPTVTARMQANAEAQTALREAEAPLGPAGPERGRIIERVTQAGVGGQSAEELRETRLAIISAIRDQIITLQAAPDVSRPMAALERGGPGALTFQAREMVEKFLEERGRIREFRTEQINAMRDLLGTVEDALRDMNESLVDQASKLRSNLNEQKTDKDVALTESENRER